MREERVGREAVESTPSLAGGANRPRPDARRPRTKAEP